MLSRSTNEDRSHSRSPRRATVPSGPYIETEVGHLNPPGDGDSDEGLDEGGAVRASIPEGNPDVDGEEGVDNGGAMGGQGEAEGGQGSGEEHAEPEEPPFEKGSFFSKIDDKDKGHYKVRDVSRFLLTSMYKRKDRVTRTPGVSLLVGKLEEPPHEEKVISAIFDTDRFSERKAAQWWEDNGHRFEDARSLAEKKVRQVRMSNTYHGRCT